MADSTTTPQDFPLPPASFEFLVESILMQTQMQLGLLHFRDEDENAPEPNLKLAKHSIDMLAILEEKTRGNLSSEEQRLLENGLTELRFRYVQASDDQKRRGPASTISSAAASATPATAVSSSTKKEEDDRPLIITADGGKGSKTE